MCLSEATRQGDLVREHFARDVRLVVFHDRCELRTAVEVDSHPVAHRKARGLSHLLDLAHQLSRRTLAPQLRCDRRIERGEQPVLCPYEQTPRCVSNDRDVVAQQRKRLAINRHVHRLAPLELQQLFTRERLDGLRRLRCSLAESLAARPTIRLANERRQRASAVGEFYRFYVELACQQRQQFPELPSPEIWHDTHQPGKRLTHLNLLLLAGRAPELGQRPNPAHRALQRLVFTLVDTCLLYTSPSP